MALRLEAFGCGQFVDRHGDLPLELGARGDVGDLAAAHAEQVVVVLREVLGKLETGELVAGRDAPNEARRLQIGEMSVGRAPGRSGRRSAMSPILTG